MYHENGKMKSGKKKVAAVGVVSRVSFELIDKLLITKFDDMKTSD